jgi:RecB family exonuclease
MIAVERFISMCNAGYMRDWSLCTYQKTPDSNPIPATELSFIINFPDGFTYKGFVDAVLQHNETGEVMVLECKTTSANAVAAAAYKNSAQAIGYSIVLDALFPSLSSYQVQYLIYKTKSKDYDVMQFEKSYLDRALWIRSLLLDIDTIKMYESASIYPQRGESCNQWMRECEYFGLCSLATESITEPLTGEESKLIQNRNANDFMINLHITDLIAAQLERV